MATTTDLTQPVNYIFLALFCLLFAFRYLRTFVSIFTWTFWKAIPIAAKPKYISKDVTVLIPTTFKTPHELMACIKRILACNPAKVFVITSSKNVELVKDMCILNNYGQQDVVVLGVDKLNKREQLLRALPSVETPITVLADDDVFWPSSEYLDYLLAIFENDRVGGGGTRQRVVRLDRPTWINMLGISYLERRVWNNCASNAVDGSISTLSGRTAAYRTKILQNDDFYFYFRNDSWRGRPLHSDDDKCLTRYVYSNGWEIKIQPDSRAVLETTVEPDFAGYQQQCLRWARAHFRGNFTVMENETYWRSRKMWWGLYVIYVSQWQTPNFFVEGILYAMLFGAVGGPSVSPYFWLALVCFFLLSKNLKMMPHFWRHPADMKFIPALMVFSYYHGCLNIWALCTMTTTHWGNKQLSEDAQTRARPEEITELIKNAKDFVDGYHEPTPGHILDGPDYFLARPQVEDKAIEHLFDKFEDAAQGAEIESTDSDIVVGDMGSEMGEVSLIDQSPAVPFDLLA